MAKDKKDFFGKMGAIGDSAGLKEVRKKMVVKPDTKENKEDEKKLSKLKHKQISLDREWEQVIKEYYSGTVTSYITMAIREKMKRDGIL